MPRTKGQNLLQKHRGQKKNPIYICLFGAFIKIDFTTRAEFDPNLTLLKDQDSTIGISKVGKGLYYGNSTNLFIIKRRFCSALLWLLRGR